MGQAENPNESAFTPTGIRGLPHLCVWPSILWHDLTRSLLSLVFYVKRPPRLSIDLPSQGHGSGSSTDSAAYLNQLAPTIYPLLNNDLARTLTSSMWTSKHR